MIERRPFCQLPCEDLGWLKSHHHVTTASQDDFSRGGWGCLRLWNDDQIAPNTGFALQVHTNIEIVTYVREGVVTHRDNLGNEGRIEAGNVQVVSAGEGIRHAEYNLEQTPARIFQIWIAPTSPGGAPAWGVHPCQMTEPPACFAVLASGFEGDHDALPIRACARVLNAKLKVGERVEYLLSKPRLAYLVPSSGAVDVNGIRIDACDGAAIKDVAIIRIAALEDTDIVMVDAP